MPTTRDIGQRAGRTVKPPEALKRTAAQILPKMKAFSFVDRHAMGKYRSYPKRDLKLAPYLAVILDRPITAPWDRTQRPPVLNVSKEFLKIIQLYIL